MRVTIRLILAGWTAFAMAGPASAAATLSIQAQLTQPVVAGCEFPIFFGFGNYLTFAAGDAVVGEEYLAPTTAQGDADGRGCTPIFGSDGAGNWNLKQVLHTSGPLAASDNHLLIGLALYSRQSDTWQLAQVLQIPGYSNQIFSREDVTSVALDGSTAVVGIGNGDEVFVYTADGGAAFSAPVKLTASDASHSHLFGSAVSVQDRVIVVSSLSATYIFEQQESGSWRKTAEFTTDPGSLSGFPGNFTETNTILDGSTVVFADFTGVVHRVSKSSGSGVWMSDGTVPAPRGSLTFLASDGEGLGIGVTNDGADLRGGDVLLYGGTGWKSMEARLSGDNMWFGGPIALDRTYLMAGESVCQDAIPCSPVRIDVARRPSDGSGFGGEALVSLGVLAAAAFRRRRTSR